LYAHTNNCKNKITCCGEKTKEKYISTVGTNVRAHDQILSFPFF
jgi:hypothetical protein